MLKVFIVERFYFKLIVALWFFVVKIDFKEIAKGVRVPVLGVGTWGLGGKHVADYSEDDYAVASICAAIDLGLTHIDTAAYYGAGHTEELVGKAIVGYDRRDLFITTKVYRTELQFDKFIISLKNSLARMKAEYADLCLIHWPSPTVPLKETMRALESCVDEGLTRFIGVSNFSASLFEEAQSFLKKYDLIADQIYYNLSRYKKTYFNGLSVADLHSYCRKKGITLVAWSPLEEGKLARHGFPVLDEMAEKYGKTPAQVSLNWLISQDNIIAIPKASKEHVVENMGAMGWKLNRKDFDALSESFALIDKI